MPSESTATLAATALADQTPPLADGTAEVNQFALLDSMASVNINNVQISFGNKVLGLGPGESGSLLMSDNAAPFPMVKIDDVTPAQNSRALPHPWAFSHGVFRGTAFWAALGSVYRLHLPVESWIP